MTKWVYSFGAGHNEGGAAMRNLLGGKGANLAEMASIGLPVPPGFTITTEVCTAYYDNAHAYPEALDAQVRAALGLVEQSVGLKFGDKHKPLLVSVRSGARVSMPGMMDTVLNLWLNDATVEGLAEASGDARFAWDSYRRFIQMYGGVVMGVDHHRFEDIIEHTKLDQGVIEDTALTAQDWHRVVHAYKEMIQEEAGNPFPLDPQEQLWGAISAVFGSLSPSSATGRILFISSIDQMNSITGTPTLGTFLGQGLGSLVASRITGFLQAITIFSVLVGGILLAPFMVAGLWLRRHSPDFLPFLVYGALLFAFSGLVSAVHVPNGTFIHSGVALAPQAYLLALEAVVALVAWFARRRPTWNVANASRVFSAGMVGITILGAVYFTTSVHETWSHERDLDQAVGAALGSHGAAPDDVVMSLDTGAIKYWTGHPGVVAPNDPLTTIESVAQAYHVRWLYVERSNAVTALGPILDGSGRPGWVGSAVWSVTGTSATTDAGLYPICFSTADPHCTVVAQLGGTGS